jgi:multidrug efflux pump subunit AcrA (membrane-fusion protein)
VHALDHQGDHASLMVVGPDNRIESRNVTLGIQMPDYVEIASGVSPGEQVVVTDRSGLKAGQVIKPKPLQSVSYEGNTQP